MAKSAKNNSVFGDVAVSLISEGKREKKKESIELLEEKETTAQPTETTNINPPQCNIYNFTSNICIAGGCYSFIQFYSYNHL